MSTATDPSSASFRRLDARLPALICASALGGRPFLSPPDGLDCGAIRVQTSTRFRSNKVSPMVRPWAQPESILWMAKTGWDYT